MLKRFGFLKTTALGGLLFLLPLIVIGALVGQIVPLVMTIAKALGELLPFTTPGGILLLILLAIIVLVLLCFAAGVVARWSLGRQFSEKIESWLRMIFPRYIIVKEQTAGTLGGDVNAPLFKPVLVRLDDLTRIAFEVERTETGQVTIYLPGSPDPWAGAVAFAEAERVEPLPVGFFDAVAICEQLGRNAQDLLASAAVATAPAESTAPSGE